MVVYRRIFFKATPDISKELGLSPIVLVMLLSSLGFPIGYLAEGTGTRFYTAMGVSILLEPLKQVSGKRA